MESIKELKNPDKIFKDAKDFLPLLGIDYIEFYVGNAKQSAHYFKSAFGFQSEAFSGLETGNRENISFVIKQEKIRLVLTSSYKSNSAVNKHWDKHGDGVKVIAFWVEDATKSFEETVRRGAKPYMKPTKEEDENGYVIRSGIHTYGETVHLFIERNNYDGVFLPGFVKWDSSYNPESIGLKYIDHIVGNVGWNKMNVWSKFYEEVLGFSQIISFDDNDISTEYTALMSKVMSSGNGRVKFPINEKSKLEVGYDGKFDNSKENMQFALSSDSESWALSGINNFKYNRAIQGFYAEYEYKINEKISIKPSLRIEFNSKNIDFAKHIEAPTGTPQSIYAELLEDARDSVFNINEINYFPNFHLTYNLTDKKNFQFSISSI